MSDTITSNGVDIGETIAKLKEVATSPGTITGTGQLYTKSTNRVYFKDGDGVEHTLFYTDTNYAEMYMDANATALVIETASTPIMSRLWTTGLVNGWTFVAGTTGAITAYADHSGTVAGTVKATDAGHGLSTGDIISIRGTTNYNGIFSITKIDNDNFYFTDTWVEDDGASDWDQGAYLLAGSGAAGIYSLQFNVTVAGTQGDICTFQAYVNTLPCTRCTIQRKFPNADIGTPSSGSLVTIAAGDRLSLVVTSDDTNSITISYGNLSIVRI